jgi:hypothetical protein
MWIRLTHSYFCLYNEVIIMSGKDERSIGSIIDKAVDLARELDNWEEYKKRLLSDFNIDIELNENDASFFNGIWQGAQHRKLQ